MILVDANVLLYAYNTSSEHHSRCRAWLEETLAHPEEPLGLPWASVLAFLRISTNSRAYPAAYSIEEAVSFVTGWLHLSAVALVSPGDRHWAILSSLLPLAQARGPLVSDAHLAALAIEHGALLCSTDRDFTRFPGLRTFNPLA
jgi:toxin-antitoxin system PIN domain toxin